MIGFTKCGHCGQSGTKLVEIEPSGANFKQNAVCCSHCNSILAVLDYHNTGRQLQLIQQDMTQLQQTLAILRREVQDVQARLNGLR